eukprot:tig00001041_g6576.t1
MRAGRAGASAPQQAADRQRHGLLEPLGGGHAPVTIQVDGTSATSATPTPGRPENRATPAPQDAALFFRVAASADFLHDDEEEVRQGRVQQWRQYAPSEFSAAGFEDLEGRSAHSSWKSARAPRGALQGDPALPPATPKTVRRVTEALHSGLQAAEDIERLAQNFYGDGYHVEGYVRKQRAAAAGGGGAEAGHVSIAIEEDRGRGEPEEGDSDEESEQSTPRPEEQEIDPEDLDPEPGMPIRGRYEPLHERLLLAKTTQQAQDAIHNRRSSVSPGIVSEDGITEEVAAYVEAVGDLGFAHDQVFLARQRVMKGVRDAIAARAGHMDPLCAVFDHYERTFEAATIWRDLMLQWQRRGALGRFVVALVSLLDFVCMNAFSYAYNFVVSAVLGAVERRYKNTRKVPPCFVCTEEDHTVVKINRMHMHRNCNCSRPDQLA